MIIRKFENFTQSASNIDSFIKSIIEDINDILIDFDDFDIKYKREIKIDSIYRARESKDLMAKIIMSININTTTSIKKKELIRYKIQQLKYFLNEKGFKNTNRTGYLNNFNLELSDFFELELSDFFESEEISEYIAHLMYLKRYSNKVDIGKTPGSYNITNIYF